MPAQLAEVVEQADAIINKLPGTASTYKMISRDVLARVKPGIIVASVGRGNVIDQDALVEALQDGRVGFAGLDVFADEPLRLDDPLWTLDNMMVLYLARHEGGAPLRLSATVGDRFPATVTAVGSVLLAQLDSAVVRDRFRGPDAFPTWTENSVSTIDRLLTKLDAVRQRGYAIDDGETLPGVFGLAVVLPPRRPGEEPLAIGASLMKASMTPDTESRVVSELIAARAHLSSPGLIRP